MARRTWTSLSFSKNKYSFLFPDLTIIPQPFKLLLWQKVTFMINKTILYSILASFFLLSCTSKDKEQYDTRAIETLDVMSHTLGELSACSYTLNAFIVEEDGAEHFTEHDVYMRGPNKMYIHSAGSRGNRSYWYDGDHMSYYSFDKNVYATIEAPDNIVQMIDYISSKHDIDFPAADFFYPGFTDDILAEFDYVLFAGDELVDGIKSTSVFMSNDTDTVQIWVDKASNLPLKLVIYSKDNASEYYEATFSNFRSNPVLPDLMFDFKPPINSESTELKTAEQN